MKHMHMTLALVSIVLFNLRFLWMMRDSELIQKKWVKITPHVVDTFLFLLGIGLIAKFSWDPFVHMWLGKKLIAVVAYIFTGLYALKLAKTKAMKVFGYLGAMGWFLFIVKLAMTKQPILFS